MQISLSFVNCLKLGHSKTDKLMDINYTPTGNKRGWLGFSSSPGLGKWNSTITVDNLIYS
jgi:hypothetical protein